MGCFIYIIHGNQTARRGVLTEMENLKDSMNGEKKENPSFVDMFSLKCFLDFQVEKSKLGVWCLGYISKQKIKVWELLAYRCFQR